MATLDNQIIAFDTGLGKTLTAVAGLVAKKRISEKNIKTIYVCPLKGLNQVYNTFRKYSKLRVQKLTGSNSGVNYLLNNFDRDVDVLLINYEAFDNPQVLAVVHQLVLTGIFNTVIADEAHTFANIHESSRNFFIATLLMKMEHQYILTATPIISDKKQYANLIALTRRELESLSQVSSAVNAGTYQHDSVRNFVQFKERDSSYTAKLHRIDCIETVYDTTYGTEIFTYTRGYKNYHAEVKLVELIQANTGKLLIFSHLTKHHNYLYDVATSLGRRVGIISGNTDTSAQDKFNNDELDCIIFSIPTELNLPADEIILYDWTSLAHQAIGRGIRSYEVDNYTAHFIVSNAEKEVSLFQNTVLKNAMYLKEAFGKDINQILELDEKYCKDPEV